MAGEYVYAIAGDYGHAGRDDEGPTFTEVRPECIITRRTKRGALRLLDAVCQAYVDGRGDSLFRWHAPSAYIVRREVEAA